MKDMVKLLEKLKSVVDEIEAAMEGDPLDDEEEMEEDVEEKPKKKGVDKKKVFSMISFMGKPKKDEKS